MPRLRRSMIVGIACRCISYMRSRRRCRRRRMVLNNTMRVGGGLLCLRRIRSRKSGSPRLLMLGRFPRMPSCVVIVSIVSMTSRCLRLRFLAMTRGTTDNTCHGASHHSRKVTRFALSRATSAMRFTRLFPSISRQSGRQHPHVISSMLLTRLPAATATARGLFPTSKHRRDHSAKIASTALLVLIVFPTASPKH
jgi:hypothetical protein